MQHATRRALRGLESAAPAARGACRSRAVNARVLPTLRALSTRGDCESPSASVLARLRCAARCCEPAPAPVSVRSRCDAAGYDSVATLLNRLSPVIAAPLFSRPKPAEVVTNIVESVAEDVKDTTRVLAVLCDNESGVLSRVAGEPPGRRVDAIVGAAQAQARIPPRLGPLCITSANSAARSPFQRSRRHAVGARLQH